MDNIRLFLIVSLAAVVLLIYQAWDHDYGQTSKNFTHNKTQIDPTHVATKNVKPDIPTYSAPLLNTQNSFLTQEFQSGLSQSQMLTVETDVLRVVISPKGGTISSAWLLNYSIAPEDHEQKVRLFKPEPPNFFVAQSGLIGNVADSLPTHDAVFSSDTLDYKLKPDQSSLTVDLFWANDSGIKVRKSFDFKRGSYLVNTRQEVINNSSLPLIAREYSQLQRTDLQDPNASRFVSTYTGGVFYSPDDKYRKVSFNDMENQRLDRQVTDGWVAMIQHYFLAALVPPKGLDETFYTNVVDENRYIIGMFTPAVNLTIGSSHKFSNQIYIGPKLQDELETVAPGLELTVDYGWLTVIAKPIHWLLNLIYSVVGNWGWAIIVLTILIKLLFYKLSETSYKSMANMRQLTPRLSALKDRYGNDKERLNQAMMELYKTEKINPLGGCLPIIIQIPVFIALYWVLLESVELRQAPFILWIHNLSVPDPYYVLPLVMGVSMFIQSKLNPAPPDPMQAKIMMSLPFVFTVFFAFFPAGLVLYWTINNILSIAQQWYITKSIDSNAEKRRR
jgi:YidC/Oxa1 family membrane protein insertase